ncbi:pfs protein [Verticillium dahliae VdLs.17]|uniref:Pfs protein n=1 Tax=Verticillium dahliae (strain VdLs.17 / ATCC MYA-4575 / FGSC 10137) TaxID=498257 RepID=G2X1I6_VERDV|nr:pfs protein [Verticillium dahliae VdLs.17]EGY22159.1 pfs protein [Verticillium dahliae VdLs.17]KAH6704544.1 pfs protein [Verticillium dahliae]
MSDGINFMKDMVGCRGRTPLSWAAREGRTKIAEALLQGGSDSDEKDARGSRPLEIALKSKHKAIAQLLIDSGASCHSSDLFEACSQGLEPILTLLLDRCETDINVLNSDGNSLVLMASELVMKVLRGIF